MKTSQRKRFQPLMSLFALVCTMLLFPACNPEALSVHDVEGEYDGTVEAELQKVPQGVVASKVHTVVSSPDNQKLRVQFDNLKVTSFNLGTFAVDCGVQYEEKAGAFNLYGEPQVEFEEYGKLPVTVTGAANGGIITLGLDITALDLQVTYTGFKKN